MSVTVFRAHRPPLVAAAFAVLIALMAGGVTPAFADDTTPADPVASSPTPSDPGDVAFTPGPPPSSGVFSPACVDRSNPTVAPVVTQEDLLTVKVVTAWSECDVQRMINVIKDQSAYTYACGLGALGVDVAANVVRKSITNAFVTKLFELEQLGQYALKVTRWQVLAICGLGAARLAATRTQIEQADQMGGYCGVVETNYIFPMRKEGGVPALESQRAGTRTQTLFTPRKCPSGVKMKAEAPTVLVASDPAGNPVDVDVNNVDNLSYTGPNIADIPPSTLTGPEITVLKSDDLTKSTTTCTPVEIPVPLNLGEATTVYLSSVETPPTGTASNDNTTLYYTPAQNGTTVLDYTLLEPLTETPLTGTATITVSGCYPPPHADTGDIFQRWGDSTCSSDPWYFSFPSSVASEGLIHGMNVPIAGSKLAMQYWWNSLNGLYEYAQGTFPDDCTTPPPPTPPVDPPTPPTGPDCSSGCTLPPAVQYYLHFKTVADNWNPPVGYYGGVGDFGTLTIPRGAVLSVGSWSADVFCGMSVTHTEIYGATAGGGQGHGQGLGIKFTRTASSEPPCKENAVLSQRTWSVDTNPENPRP